MLYKATGRNKFCVPTSLSALFGVPTHEITADLREITMQSLIKGVHLSHTESYLESKNIDYWKQEMDEVTINQFVVSPRTGRYLVSTSDHMFAICFDTGTFVDTGSLNKPARKLQPIQSLYGKKHKLDTAYKILGGSVERKPTKPKVKKAKPTSFLDLYTRYSCVELRDMYVVRSEAFLEFLDESHDVHVTTDDDYSTVLLLLQKYDVAISDNESVNRESLALLYWDTVLDYYDDEVNFLTSVKTIRLLAGRYGINLNCPFN